MYEDYTTTALFLMSYKNDDSNKKGKSHDKAIEKMVKKRIIEGKFDDPVSALARDELISEVLCYSTNI